MHTQTTREAIVRTGKVGEIEATFEDLQEVFGPPDGGDDDGKTRVNWYIRFDDGTVASIYDWKESQPLEAVTDWHVGGKTHAALAHVLQAMKGE